MSKYRVLLAVARGACLDIGQRISMTVLAPSRLDAAVQAEQIADTGLSDREYSHAKRVDWIPWGEAASLAVAA
jgi:hypothetical protein